MMCRLVVALSLLGSLLSQEPRFANGLPNEPTFFPIGVWLQDPTNAARYADLGINLYVGLFDGPTKAQLETLAKAKMRVICAQNDTALAFPAGTIVGWMHGDEPDNAQGGGMLGYGPPVEPWKVVESYEAMRKKDKTRPVLLNLGQGAAWDGWHGRGKRSGHFEDYAEYAKGCDVVAFDIYPVTHPHRDVRGKLEFVGRGVQRMHEASGGKKPIWACLESARVGAGDERPTPQQIENEAWIAVCCGASGIVWFAHEFAPSFVETGLLQYPEIAEAVKTTDRALLEAAKALAAPRDDDAIVVTTKPKAEVAVRVHRLGNELHVFAASMTNTPLHVTFTPRGGKGEPWHVDLAAYGHDHHVVRGAAK